MEKQARVGGDKMAKLEYDVLMQYKAALEAGKSARTVSFDTDDEQQIAKNLFLLTSKPVSRLRVTMYGRHRNQN